jgi:chitinase
MSYGVALRNGVPFTLGTLAALGVNTGGGSPPRVATPTFSPVAGAYLGTQSVTISCLTAGATIYYTVDGSMPTAGSTVYTVPVSISTTTTLKAIAIDGVIDDSYVASGLYTITTTAVYLYEDDGTTVLYEDDGTTALTED